MKIKNKLYKIILIIVFVIFLIYSGCEKSTGPEITKDPRKYTWTIDTLYHPESYQTIMENIWGSSVNDVYVVGHNDTRFGKMYHYNGKKWSEVILNQSEGGTISNGFDLWNIIGFSKNDIWVIGERITDSFLMHYDGKKWQEVILKGGESLFRITGNSKNNIYVAGRGKFFWHYDGLAWTMDAFPIQVPSIADFQITNIFESKSGDLLVSGLLDQQVPFCNSYYFYVKREGKWILKDSTNTNLPNYDERKYNYSKYWVSPEGNLYSLPSGAAYQWDGEKFNWATGAINNNYPGFIGICGTSENNIFVGSLRGKVAHFNGTDWHRFTELADFNIDYTGVWTDGTEVFIVGSFSANDGSIRSVVLHGK
jgi:hypothetical protein